jgi:hypothetical protein
MKLQGVIERQIVSLNFEDPTDPSQQSTVAFGEIDESQIAGGKKGLTWYSNVGFQEWALLVDHVMYDGVHAHDDKDVTLVHTKIAIIDSGNNSIQLPQAEFRKIQSKMMGQV